MRTKKELEKELRTMRGQIAGLTTKSATMDTAIAEKAKAEDTTSNILVLYKIMLENQRQTQIMLKQLANNVDALTTEIGGGIEDEAYQNDALQGMPERQARELPISGLDAKIIQFIQVKGMVCADDIKSTMNYKGRNAASSRLNKLYKQGVLERYQLGHKVYYKYDAGKATNLLIVSPPQ
ncbi:MAG TPA: hypothetical protein VMV00_01365 [Candidatus Baltobacteraceae bacterium]|nr:hypothetical protein [Candidatus Baltobacteraceae bacterium]